MLYPIISQRNVWAVVIHLAATDADSQTLYVHMFFSFGIFT